MPNETKHTPSLENRLSCQPSNIPCPDCGAPAGELCKPSCADSYPEPDPNNCPECGEFLYEPHAPGCPADAETNPNTR